MTVLSIGRDYQGLKQAALELLEEDRTRPERERLRKLAESASEEQRPKLLAAAADLPRTLSPAFYQRMDFIAQLEELVEAGQAAPLTFAEWTGLRALRAARAEHEAQHPPCPKCGAGLEHPGALSCRCGWRRPAKQAAA